MKLFFEKRRHSLSIFLILLVQTLLVFYTFEIFFITPTDYLFQNQFDGLKNYFTFYQYVTTPKSDMGWFHFQNMNYPFGDYIFYTDNTPLLSFPIKLFNQLFPLLNFNFTLFNSIILLNIPLCSVLFYLLLNKKINNYFLLIVSSICIAWINPQLQRLGMGHFNLSISSFILLAIYGLYKIDLSLTRKNTVLWIVFLMVVVFCSTFFHFYFLPILLIPIGFYILYRSIEVIKLKWFSKKVLRLSSAIIACILIIYLSIRVIDTYYKYRNSGAGGYGYHIWKLIPEALIKPYSSIKTIPFPLDIFNCYSEVPYESMSYLGIFIISALIVGVVTFFYYWIRDKRKLSVFLKTYRLTNSFWIIIFISGILSYFVSMGDYVNWCNHIKFDNWLNPFYFIKFDFLTQFRCLGRFVWIFFWGAAFASVFIVNYFLNRTKNNRLLHYSILFISILFLSADTYDLTLDKKTFEYENILNKSHVDTALKEIEGKIDFKNYQSLLCLPFYHVGVEMSQYLIDDEPRVSDFSYKLAIKSQLPMFNSKMSRTPEYQGKAIFEIIENGHIPAIITKKLNDKPILVVKDLKYYPYDTTKEYVHMIKTKEKYLDVTYHMDTILMTSDSLLYLTWDWVKNN